MATEPGAEAAARSSGIWGTAAVIGGGALLALAAFTPVWVSRLAAPQYPGGLWLLAYGGWVEGDLSEINGLNHYIGMQPFDVAIVWEIWLWAPLLVAFAILLPIVVYQRGVLGRLALAGLWLAPLAVLADIQRWLWVFGTNLDPRAALHLDPFIPLAVGPTSVWNFQIWAFPGPALVLAWGAALAATLGRRTPLPSFRWQVGSGVVAVALVVVSGVWTIASHDVQVIFRWPLVQVGPARVAAVTGDGSDFDLAAAVAAAAPGDEIRVPAGTYRVNLEVDRPLTLVADGAVTLDGGGDGQVVRVSGSDVTIRDFRIVGSGRQVDEGAGILVTDAQRVAIEGNRFERTYIGIAVHGSADVRIVGNAVVGWGQVMAGAGHAAGADGDDPADHSAPSQGDGISVWNSSDTLIQGNRIERVRDGIYLSYADSVLVDGNTVTASRYAVHAMFGADVVAFGNDFQSNVSGLVLMYTDGVIVGRNRVVDHQAGATGYGVLLKDVTAPQIRENLFVGNRVGLHADGALAGTDGASVVEAVVIGNRFAANRVGVELMATADLAFADNAFDGNLIQVLALEGGVERRNVWVYHNTGNAWSDYGGFDRDGDGAGDMPYLSGGVAAAVLTRSPALDLLVTTPAFQLLAAAQSWWQAGFDPVLVDPRPTTDGSAARAAPARTVVPEGGVTLAVGVSLAGAAGGAGLWALGRLRRERRGWD